MIKFILGLEDKCLMILTLLIGNEFLPLSTRFIPGSVTANTFHAPAPISWNNINDPNVEGYFFTKQQVIGAFPKVAEAYDKVGRIDGSGFLVANNGTLVTAEHVVDLVFQSDDVLKINELLLGGVNNLPLRGAKLLYRNKGDDSAAIHIPSLQRKGFINCNLTPQDYIGDVVFLIGNPNNIAGNNIEPVKQVITVGRLLSYNGKTLKVRILAGNGNSGGPLLNRKGECIGFIQQHSEDSNLIQECLSMQYFWTKITE